MRQFQARAVMPKAALMDAGLAWLFGLIKTRLGGGESGSPRIGMPRNASQVARSRLFRYRTIMS